MNDEFLYRLRTDPPPEFAARLKARLDLLPRPSFFATRSLVRPFIVALLVGGSVLAVTWLATNEKRGSTFPPFNAAERIPASGAAPPPVSVADDGYRLAEQTAGALDDLPPARASNPPIPAIATKPRGSAELAIVGSRATAALASLV